LPGALIFQYCYNDAMRWTRFLFVLSLWTGPGFAADYAPAPVVVQDAECMDAGAINRIIDRFAWAERTQWHRGFVIETISNPRPSGHPFAEPGLVHRDYCIADSVMTNGSLHSIFYTIERGLGFAGVGRNVDFCVLGLDPWHVHDGNCRTVR
jgi:hypothetical protein